MSLAGGSTRIRIRGIVVVRSGRKEDATVPERRVSRVSISLPRALLRYAKTLASARGETLDRLVMRALVSEVRLLTIESWTKTARESARYVSGGSSQAASDAADSDRDSSHDYGRNNESYSSEDTSGGDYVSGGDTAGDDDSER